MQFLTRLAEEKITQALAEGQFDNLPGHGKPIALEDFSNVPEHMRSAFKILKNAGVLPLEMDLLKETATLLEQLSESKNESEQQRIRRELNDKSLKFELLMEQNRRSRQKNMLDNRARTV